MITKTSKIRNKDISHWMNPADGSTIISLPQDSADNALYVNVRHQLYYIVNYDEQNWSLLGKLAQDNCDAISNAIGITADLKALKEAKHIGAHLFKKLSSVFKKCIREYKKTV